LAKRLFGAPISLFDLGNGQKETGISGKEIGRWRSDSPISFDNLPIPGREIGVSSEEIGNFFFPTTQLKWRKTRISGETE